MNKILITSSLCLLFILSLLQFCFIVKAAELNEISESEKFWTEISEAVTERLKNLKSVHPFLFRTEDGYLITERIWLYETLYSQPVESMKDYTFIKASCYKNANSLQDFVPDNLQSFYENCKRNIQNYFSESVDGFVLIPDLLTNINGDNLQIGYIIAIGLVGDYDQAAEYAAKIDADKLYPADHFLICGIRAFLYYKLRQYENALHELETGGECPHLLRRYSATHDFFYAYLLHRSGKVKEAAKLYQRIVDLYPGTKISRYSEKLMKESGEFIEPTAKRIVSMYFCKQPDDYAFALDAFVRHNFKETFDIFTDELKSCGSPYADESDIIYALGILRDRRAVPILLQILDKKDDKRFAVCESIYYVLARCGKLKCADEIVNDAFLFNKRSEADTVLRDIFNGGPEIPAGSEPYKIPYEQLWENWIKSQESD